LDVDRSFPQPNASSSPENASGAEVAAFSLDVSFRGAACPWPRLAPCAGLKWPATFFGGIRLNSAIRESGQALQMRAVIDAESAY
jgi:hypothetical protein